MSSSDGEGIDCKAFAAPMSTACNGLIRAAACTGAPVSNASSRKNAVVPVLRSKLAAVKRSLIGVPVTAIAPPRMPARGRLNVASCFSHWITPVLDAPRSPSHGGAMARDELLVHGHGIDARRDHALDAFHQLPQFGVGKLVHRGVPGARQDALADHHLHPTGEREQF